MGYEVIMSNIPLNRKVKGMFYSGKWHRFLSRFATPFQTIALMSRASEWIENHPPKYMNDMYNPIFRHDNRYKMYQEVFLREHLDDPILYLEFGVEKGDSFRWWCTQNTHEDSRFFGFDTFTGLPEDFNEFKKGTMSAQGKQPDIEDARVRFIPGLFQDTLPGFLRDIPQGLRKVIHLDADLYTSTLYVLTMLHPFLKKNDVIFFDEFNVPMHEFRAFTDFCSAYRINYQVLGAVNNFYQISLMIL
jgi:O-methyltransferase